MTKKMWKKLKRMKAEHAQTEAAGRKRGLWGSIGGTLLGGVATILTAGAAAPTLLASLGTGLAAGGASFVGGHLGNWAAGRTDKGDLSGGRYFTEERADLGKQIKEGIGARAVKTGIQAAMFSALKGGKKLLKGKKLGKELIAEGEASLSLGPGDRGFMTPEMKTNLSKSIAKEVPTSLMATDKTAWEVLQSSGPQKVPELGFRYKTPGIKGALQRFFGGDSSPTHQGTGAGWESTDISPGKGLSAIEQSWRSTVESGDYQTPVRSKLTTSWEGQGQKLLPQRDKYGAVTGYGSSWAKPNVPFEAPIEDTFFTEPVGNIQDFDFSIFDEASWEEGRKTLSNIDFESADEQIPWQKRILPKTQGFEPKW